MSCDESIHSSKNQHFFKIILEETLKEKSLLIPKKFVRIYGETLSDTVHIKLPCGSHWEMELTKREGRAWLTRGWSEFAKHYSLARGHMLVFRYQGSSKFRVVIFDATAVEIDDYPKINLDDRDIIDVDDSVGILDHINPQKQVRTNPEIKTKGLCELRTSKKNSLNKGEKTAAMEKANGFNTNLPNFKVFMQPSYVRRSELYLPTSFVTQYLKKKRGNAILKVRSETRMSWSITYISKKNIKNGRTITKICSGWGKFVRDNALEVGDVCLFVMLKGKMVFFEVEIFRANNEPSDLDRGEPLVNGSDSDSDFESESESDDKMEIESCETSYEARILDRAHFQSEKPFFKVIMKPECFAKRSHVRVPLHLAKKYIQNNEKVVLWGPNGKPWTVLFQVSGKTSKFYGDWNLFVQTNDLKLGDVCIFELIDIAEISFKVSIVRIGSDQDAGDSCGYFPAKRAKRPKNQRRDFKFGKKKKSHVTAMEKARALERAHFESEKPFFKLLLRRSDVRAHYRVPIPSSFSQAYIKNESLDIGLCVPDKTATWRAKLITRRGPTTLCHGWKEFVNSNYLIEGDVCIFELINQTEILFRVSIFRRYLF